TLSLHDALPISAHHQRHRAAERRVSAAREDAVVAADGRFSARAALQPARQRPSEAAPRRRLAGHCAGAQSARAADREGGMTAVLYVREMSPEELTREMQAVRGIGWVVCDWRTRSG